jgi:predicted nucleotidyltransferase
MKQFYESWQKKTQQEKKYIKALEKALNWLQEQPFKKDILAVYVKGSFVYRELNKDSDIDLVPIMKDEKSLNLTRELRDKVKEKLKPVDILPLALEELKNNEYFKKPLPGTKGAPDQFTLLLSENRLVYGKPLNTTGFKVRSDRKIYEVLKEVIKNKQIPMYEKGEFGFRQVGKQFMHLVWWEERLKGRKIDSSWIAMKAARPDHELLQRTIEYRYNPTKDKSIRKRYINQLKEYLSH